MPFTWRNNGTRTYPCISHSFFFFNNGLGRHDRRWNSAHSWINFSTISDVGFCATYVQWATGVYFRQTRVASALFHSEAISLWCGQSVSWHCPVGIKQGLHKCGLKGSNCCSKTCMGLTPLMATSWMLVKIRMVIFVLSLIIYIEILAWNAVLPEGSLQTLLFILILGAEVLLVSLNYCQW